VLQGVATAGATTIVTGTLTGPEGALYRVELFAADACDTSGLMEGKTLLRADEMTIGFTGRVVFVRNLAGAYPRLTATATRIEAGKPADTSEFAPPDISVAGVEITQAIQNLKNEAPLIAGKPTVIRAFLKSQSCDVTQVGAKLTGPPGEILFEEIGTAAALPAEPVRPAFRERGDLARSLEIRTLPQNWQQGPATWTVEANPGCTRPDAECDEANRLEVNGVTFRTTRPMTLAFVPIRITLGGVERTPEAAEYSGYCSAFSLYPMAAGSIRCDTSAKPLGFGGDLGTLAGWSKLVAYLKNYNFFTKDPGPNTHWYGVVDDAVPLGASHILGIGYGDDGTEAAGRVDAHVGAIVLIHEIGHNYNRLHPGCLAGESAGKDGGWPYQPCEFGRSSADGYWGFDYSAWTPIDPTSRADFMSYKTPAWVSDYTYLGIYTKLKTSASLSTGSSAEVRRSDTGGAGPGGMAATGSARPPVTPGGTTGPALAQGAANDGVVSAGQEYLAVSGRINLARGTAAFDPLYHTVESDTAYAPQPGAYTLELSDLSGKTRVSHAFDLADPHLSTAAEAVYFAEILPWDAAAARLRLKRGTAILADRAASAHRPEVRLIYPNGGETLSGDAAVRWTAADADGDSLGFVLQYSHDGGASWQAVALDLWTTGYTVRAGELPGGNNGFFRVLASDGFHTAQDRSDGPFSVERKPPRATILAPVDGGAPEAGAPLTLWGAGSDPETGVLGDAALAWSDNIAGQLGTGGQVVLPLGLPAGWHVLTLTATDGDGMRGTAQARVCVGCPRADLALAMGAAPDPIRAGSRLTYTLATTNAGPADATGVIVTDTLPVEVRFVSAAPSRGTCGLGGGGVLTCSVGALAAGDGATIILSVDVPKPIAVEALYNVAEVIADQADPDRLDNAALVETSVEGATPPTPQNCYLPVLLKRR
jgi:uncharacterized repeat protein (TIGR01451 family)